MPATARNYGGFTMIEIMIAVVIVSILLGVAYPAYENSIMKTRRAEGKAALLDLQNRMERYFIDQGSYSGATASTLLGGTTTTENGHYALAVQSSAATSYVIKATPQGTQATADSDCGTLAITSTGEKGVMSGSSFSANQACW